MEDLPEHLIMEEIIPRLPLTSIFDFRSVCRNLRYQLANNTHCVLVHSTPPCKQVLQSPTTGFITYPNTSRVYIVPDMDTPMVNKMNIVSKRFEICVKKCELSVSCNGLVCFVNTSCNTTIVGNPVTRDYIETQHPYDVGGDQEHWGIGLGFDSKSKEFKLIWLYLSINTLRRSLRDSEGTFCVLAHTLGGSFTWRRIGNLRKQIQVIQSRRPVFYNGSLHWLCFENEGVCVINVIAVNVADDDDEEQVLYFPISFISPAYFNLPLQRIHLGVLGGCLILVDDTRPVHVEVWVMKEYGIDESWSKDFVIPRPIMRHFESIYKTHHRFHPLIMQEDDGQILVESDDQLLLYDPVSKTFKDTNILSLVLLNHNGALRELRKLWQGLAMFYLIICAYIRKLLQCYLLCELSIY